MVLFLRFLGIYQEATREMCFVFNPNGVMVQMDYCIIFGTD